ncbi:hypothetical protein TNCV_4857741 [Trichonephila clavipes]|nr:hypothetical protein TNCV_4857741 [Trichonephila clavipes]
MHHCECHQRLNEVDPYVIDLFSMSLTPLWCHWTNMSLWMTPGRLKHFLKNSNILCRPFDLSSMSLDPSSMSCDPRVKTILGRPLFHWTCPPFHLTPVSIVICDGMKTFLSPVLKIFVGGKFEKFYFAHT